MVRMVVHGRISSLFSTEINIPKLDVAGSIPVSRSMFSITYKESASSTGPLNAVIVIMPDPKSLKKQASLPCECQRKRLTLIHT